MRETAKDKIARTKKIIAGLEKTYPDAHCELVHQNPLELLIATILSAQCTDKRVNIVTEQLFKKYRSAPDFANADISELENDVRTTGFYKNKARNIKAASRDIVEKHSGKVPWDARRPMSFWETRSISTSVWSWTLMWAGFRIALG
jgi:endonuclease III